MSILDTIVADTRTLVASRKRDVTAQTLRTRPLYHEPRREFAKALRSETFAIIAELKRRSPSKGEIRADFDVGSLADAYSCAGAAALSVLCEPFHFGGSIEYLETARQHSQVPVMRKDFIIDPYQIVEARAYGADAVLLIATILDRTQLAELQDACQQEGLEALVEVYEAAEIDRIDVDRTPVIGANSRDLHTFSVDLERTCTILSSLPDHVVKVAESGINDVADVRQLHDHGINAFLIGERFMSTPNPGVVLADWLAQLRMPTQSDVHKN